MDQKIIRLEQTDKETLGILLIDNKIFCCTLELPWRYNQRDISCIPTGKYTCKKYNSPKYESTYIVNDVFDRGYILFHVRNTINDTEGCILLGKDAGYLQNTRAILNSTHTFQRWLYKTRHFQNFELEIVEYY